MPLINDNYQMMQDQGVNFVAVNVGETPVRVSSFIKDIGGTDYPILMDTNSSVEKAYGIYNLPVTFIINKKVKSSRNMKVRLIKRSLKRW